MSVEIRGAEQLANLAKQLSEAADKGLQRELGKGINRAVKPLKDALKQSAKDWLPSSGGLAARVAKSKFTTRRYARRTGARVGGIRVVGKGDLSLYHLDQGQVRHRQADGGWTIQSIRPGWWTDPTEKAAPQIRTDLEQVLADIAKQIKA